MTFAESGIETLDEHVAGAGSMSVLVERDGGVKDLALLQKMESFEERLREYKNPVSGKHLVTGVASLLNVIKETNRALNEGTRHFIDCRTLSVVFRMRCSFLRTPVLTIRGGFSTDSTKTLMNFSLHWIAVTEARTFHRFRESGSRLHLW